LSSGDTGTSAGARLDCLLAGLTAVSGPSRDDLAALLLTVP